MFRILLEQLIMYNLTKHFVQQGLLFGDSLCNRIEDMERFSTHPRDCPSQVATPTRAKIDF